MATKNAHRRPHCVDLTPPAFDNGATTGNSDKSGRSTTGNNHRLTRQSSPQAGAVRRNPKSAEDGSSGHIGKIFLAMIVLAGTAVWTTSSSEPYTAGEAQEITLKAAISAPAFFFDDESDALEQKHEETTADEHAIAKIDSNQMPSSEQEGPDLLNLQLTGEKDQTLAMLTEPQTPPFPDAVSFTDSIDEKNDPDSSQFSNHATDAEADDYNIESLDALFTADTDINKTDLETPEIQRVTVKSGDTLSGILNLHGVKTSQLGKLLADDIVKEQLTGIEPGQVIELTFNENSEFTALTTRTDVNTRVNIERIGTDFTVSAVDLPIERRRVVTAGRIDQSLYLAAEQADLKQSTIMELADIFQWELDFARDIRQDDKFSLVYEQLYREGEYIGDGNILAAEFVRGGKAYNAIRFTTDDGDSDYYSPDGQSKRRTFMRHPVDVVRITSKFNPNRLHPVLHKIRAHRGVDYGSPHGSPIYATADGKITFSGPKSAYGNTVVLKHGEKFSTLYAHMSKISSKSKVGQRVNQGDVIGYVGKTGRVTGTHLHYEFRVNGVQIDPLKVELPAASPIDKKYLTRLEVISEEFSKQMTKALEELDDRVAAATNDLRSLPSTR